MSVAPPAKRSLDKEFSPYGSASTSTFPRKFDILSGTIYTHAGRLEAGDLFVNCCRLAAHHTTSIRSNRFLQISTSSYVTISSRTERDRLSELEQMDDILKNYDCAFQDLLQHDDLTVLYIDQFGRDMRNCGVITRVPV
jgi:hypothetical protein